MACRTSPLAFALRERRRRCQLGLFSLDIVAIQRKVAAANPTTKQQTTMAIRNARKDAGKIEPKRGFWGPMYAPLMVRVEP